MAALFNAKEVRALIGAQHEVCRPRSADREEVLATGEEWTNGMAEMVALMSTSYRESLQESGHSKSCIVSGCGGTMAFHRRQ